MPEYPRTIRPEHLAAAIRQTRRMVYPDDWTPVPVVGAAHGPAVAELET